MDNTLAFALGKNHIFHDRSKYINKGHFIRESINKEEVEMKYMKSQDQIADILIKLLKFEDFTD